MIMLFHGGSRCCTHEQFRLFVAEFFASFAEEIADDLSGHLLGVEDLPLPTLGGVHL